MDPICRLLFLLTLCSTLASVQAMNVNVLPVSQTVGAAHMFQFHPRVALTAVLAMLAAHYGVQQSKIVLIFGGQLVQDLCRLKDIPGFQDGHTLLMVIRQNIQRVLAPTLPDLFQKAKDCHDTVWGRVANYDIGSPPADPALPDHHERNYVCAVAVILTEDVRGIVELKGLPGGDNFFCNIILAIIYYYKKKGWPALKEAFIQRVWDSMDEE